MIPLPKPPKIVEKKENQASFVIEALYPIKGVDHEFTTLPGVLEDVITICLNLKKLRFRLHSDEPQQATLKARGEKKITGADFSLPAQLELINKDLHIATLTAKNADLEMEILVQKGIGYEPREMRDKEKLEIGQISLDAIYSPVKRVSYKVENMRVGERTDFDRLSIDIETDGSIAPEEALIEATEILIKHLSIIFDEKANLIKGKIKKEGKSASKKAKSKTAEGEKAIDEIGLSARTLGALFNAHIKSVAGLVRKKEEDLLKLEGLGPKGVKEVKKALKKLGMELKAQGAIRI